MKPQTLVVTYLLCLVVGGFIGAWLFSTQSHTTNTVHDVVTKVDTVTRIIEREQVRIVEAPARVVYVPEITHDTVYQTRAFVATLDTIIEHDTVDVSYTFPQHTFSVLLRQRPDSIRYVTREVTITKQRGTPWYEYVGSALAGVVVGYIARGN